MRQMTDLAFVLFRGSDRRLDSRLLPKTTLQGLERLKRNRILVFFRVADVVAGEQERERKECESKG